MLVDEPEAIELTLRQAGNALRQTVVRPMRQRRPITVRQTVRIVQAYPHLAQYGATPELRVLNCS